MAADVDVDVIIVGAGPTGLMLAIELCSAGVRPLVLERRPQSEKTPRANGLPGQVLEVLRYRGLLDRISREVGQAPRPAPSIPFGGLQLDLSGLADSPLWALGIRQPRLERVLGERAVEAGADVRRGHELVDLRQDRAGVTVDVSGPDGLYRLRTRYVAGCDGGRSRVRELAGIAFPGTTYPEVNRLGQVGLSEAAIRLDDGDLQIPGLGRIRQGFTRTDRGVFAFGWQADGVLMVQTTEDQPAGDDPALGEGGPLTLAELEASIRRVLGADLPLGAPLRLSRYGFAARQAERYRDGRIFVVGDAAHQFPSTGVGLSAGMLDAVNLAWKLAADVNGWASTGLLDSYHDERHFAGARTMAHTQAQVALRRGQDSAAEALRDLFRALCADEQPQRRIAALVAGADLRYPTPDLNQHPLTGTLARDLTLHTCHGATTVAEVMRSAPGPARPRRPSGAA